MPRPVAQCGTDAGYFRHRRTTKTEPCEPCKAAHSAATHRDGPARSNKTCACGRGMRHDRDQCTYCTRQAAARPYTYSDTEDDPKRPVAWRPNGRGIQVPVYESEVA